MIRSTAIQRSRSTMFGCALTCVEQGLVDRHGRWRRQHGRCGARHGRPRVSGAGRADPSASGENGTPCATSHSMARALCSAMKRAVCSSTSPAPASCVSRTCDSMLSSLPEHADDAALRPGGGALVEAALGKHDDGAVCGQVECDGQPGQPGADDHDRRRRRLQLVVSCVGF